MASLLAKFFGRHKGKEGEIPKEYIRQFLPAAPIVIEAGAHIGVDTVEMAKLWPDGTVYAFEPVPEIFGQLERNTRGCRNVLCFPVALSAEGGETELFVSSGASDGSSSLLRPKEHLTVHPDVLFDTTLRIRTVRLDQWAEANGVRRADLLWLDLQGAELKVLKSAGALLQTVSAIHTEVSLIENYEGGELYQDLKEWLESQGFVVAREEMPWKDMGNVLFVRKGAPATGGPGPVAARG